MANQPSKAYPSRRNHGPYPLAEQRTVPTTSRIHTHNLAWVGRAPGTHNALPEQPMCAYCPAGSLQELAGATECATCPSGSHCAQGASAALPCPGGTFRTDTGATGPSDCLICPAGSSCPTGSTASTPCRPKAACRTASTPNVPGINCTCKFRVIFASRPRPNYVRRSPRAVAWQPPSSRRSSTLLAACAVGSAAR